MIFKNLLTIPRLVIQHNVRNMSIAAKSLTFREYGEPLDVLELSENCVEKPTGSQVLVKVLAAPINPADINTIQGRYAIKPKFPAVGGNEFVGEIVEVGSEVKNLKVGQRVIPYESGIGTWTTHKTLCEDQLMPVPTTMSLVEAATLTVNPPTAYCMLKLIVQLQPGDCVIQNGANSAVGQAVHQMCKAWGYKSVGVVRDRPEIAQLKEYLKNLGADEVLTQEELRTTTIFKDGKLPNPRLAFNCVGGKSATELSRHLADRGVMVTYGGMSREPVELPVGPIIFKDFTYKGFWLTRWTKENRNSPARTAMFKELCEMIEQKKLLPPVHEFVPITQFKEAIGAAANFKGFNGKKFLLKMDN